MSQLSAYHLRRPRLTSRLLAASASVIVGGAGYGKSALAAETAASLDLPVIATALESAGVSAALLPYRLRSAAARVGLSDLAALMDQAVPAGPAGVLDAMLEALAGSGALIVVDEVQHAEPEALALLTRLAGSSERASACCWSAARPRPASRRCAGTAPRYGSVPPTSR